MCNALGSSLVFEAGRPAKCKTLLSKFGEFRVIEIMVAFRLRPHAIMYRINALNVFRFSIKVQVTRHNITCWCYPSVTLET